MEILLHSTEAGGKDYRGNITVYTPEYFYRTTMGRFRLDRGIQVPRNDHDAHGDVEPPAQLIEKKRIQGNLHRGQQIR